MPLVIVYLIFVLIWFVGLGAAAFHVIKYSTPTDKLVISFLVFFPVAAVLFLWSISFVLGGS